MVRNLWIPLKDKVAPERSSSSGDCAVARLARLLKAIYYLQLVEVVGLVLISFIHNREHYRELPIRVAKLLL